MLRQSPSITFTADSDSNLIRLPMHQAISSSHDRVVKWQVTKRCPTHQISANWGAYFTNFLQKRVCHKIPFQNFVLKFTCLCVQSDFTRQTKDFLPVQTNIIEALILLRLGYRWSHKFRHYLPVDLLLPNLIL